ncbi:MAG: hypothetical protein ABSF59_14300 [Candidatus Sulfotelmatobacter sp.]|jgi:hypothetical protein
MPRLITRFLLFFALAGNLAPIALAANAATPTHACCLRKGIHRCHDTAAPESSELVVRGAGCCHQECCRAVTTVRWAHAAPHATGFAAQNIEAYLSLQSLATPNNEVSRFQSTRAPPAVPHLRS